MVGCVYLLKLITAVTRCQYKIVYYPFCTFDLYLLKFTHLPEDSLRRKDLIYAFLFIASNAVGASLLYLMLDGKKITYRR